MNKSTITWHMQFSESSGALKGNTYVFGFFFFSLQVFVFNLDRAILKKKKKKVERDGKSLFVFFFN